MAVGTILLSPGSAVPPDGTANNAAPATVRSKSSGSAPAIYLLQLSFDATTEEWATWSFRCPVDYASGFVAKVQYKMTSATTGGVAWDVRLAAYTPTTDTTDLDVKVFAAANVGTQTVPATTAGRVAEVSVTLTNADSIAAGDYVVVRCARAVANAADTATGDAELIMLALEYTTT